MKAIVVAILIAVGLLTISALMADAAVKSTTDIELRSRPLVSSPPSTTSGILAQGIPPALLWHTATVDSKGIWESSLVLDKDDRPHISYPAIAPLDGDLNYARWTGSQWQVETVDSMKPSWYSEKSVLKLDGAGYPHIGYCVCNDFICALDYAHWTGSQWIIQEIDPGISGGSFSMALDESDHPHFSYCRQYYNLELRYAYWAGSQWFSETIGADSGCWASTSIALDASERPHISYYNTDTGDLVYAHWTGTMWITQTVDNAGYVGNSNSLMLDTSGKPHIGYFDWSNESLKYAVWTGTDWNIQIIDSAGKLGSDGSHVLLVLDDQDRPHFIYTGADNNTIKYARWTGNERYTYTVDTGAPSWIALDSTHRPHVSYQNSGLKYAWGQVLTMTTYLPAVATGQQEARIARDER